MHESSTYGQHLAQVFLGAILRDCETYEKVSHTPFGLLVVVELSRNNLCLLPSNVTAFACVYKQMRDRTE